MGVAAHLNIPLDEYDTRIRTFIPGYDQMLDAAANAIRAAASDAPTMVDLGVGTGALAARCMAAWDGDTTEFVIGESCKLYLAALLDLFSRFVVGSAVSATGTCSKRCRSP